MYKKLYPKVNLCNGLHKIRSQTSLGLGGKTSDGCLLGASWEPPGWLLVASWCPLRRIEAIKTIEAIKAIEAIPPKVFKPAIEGIDTIGIISAIETIEAM